MFHVQGSCYCSNILVDAELSRATESYNPRACDCDFCRKQGASYLSDPAGKLRFQIKDRKLLGKYHQEEDVSGIATFLHCLKCGVLVGVMHQEGTRIFGALNSSVLDRSIPLGEKVSVSPKTLSDEAKLERWKQVWFGDVTFT